MFQIRDAVAGNKITSADTIETARKIVRCYENLDRAEGIYTPNFYEIYDLSTGEIVE